ncbi:hypothetical protein M885DRAFT_522368 [Pelagophyceae sp. CCMP2097]|nr:hypothetical protein M885DRAFT_522368 [Pelagophyceae sp. CCMP2097]
MTGRPPRPARHAPSRLHSICLAMFCFTAVLGCIRAAVLLKASFGAAVLDSNPALDSNPPAQQRHAYGGAAPVASDERAAVAVDASGSAVAAAAPGARLALLLLMRDEEALLRDHLPLWLPLAHCAVGAVDDRTVDGSAKAFLEATSAAPTLRAADGTVRRFLYHYNFGGLGPARTLLVREALDHFGGEGVTHALFVDPDWRPTGPTASYASAVDRAMAAAPAANVFVFKVFDRNERTERLLDWCFQLKEGVHLKYRWHEELRMPAGTAYTAALLDDWAVEEVAGASVRSWHFKAHGSDSSAARYEFEIGQLELDLEEATEPDARLHYYLGVDYLAWAAATKDAGRFRLAIMHLEKRIAFEGLQRYDGSVFSEMTYVSYLQLASAHAQLGDGPKANWAVDEAHTFDHLRVEAALQKVGYLLNDGGYEAAFAIAETAANLKAPVRLFYHHSRAYDCDAKLAVVQVALTFLSAANAAATCEAPQAMLAKIALQRLAQVDDACAAQFAAALRGATAVNRADVIRLMPCGAALPVATSGNSFTKWDDLNPGGADATYLCKDADMLEKPRAAWQSNDAVGAVKALHAASTADPQCCIPYREFSTVFLGEAPLFAKLDALALHSLEAHLRHNRDLKSNPDWHTLALYGLAQIQIQDGLDEGAVTLTPLVQRRPGTRRGPSVCKTCKLRFVAVASDLDHAGVKELRDSAKHAGVDVEILHVQGQYSGHELKMKHVHDWLLPLAASEPGAVVVMVDAYDVVLWPAAADMRRRFADMDADVVFGGDATCYPDLGLGPWYPGYDHRGAEDRGYVNSGTIAATAGSLLRLLRSVAAYGAATMCGPDDQRAFHRAFLSNSAELKLVVDTEATLFHTLHRELRAMSVDAAGQLHVAAAPQAERPTSPCLSHGNAGDGKAFYTEVVAARRSAVSTTAAVEVAPPLFVHGLELWRRGHVAEAEAAWREYVAARNSDCGAPFMAQTFYSLGVLAGKDDPKTALQHYASALACEPTHVDSTANSAISLTQLGRHAEAVVFIERAVALDPNSDRNVATAKTIKSLADAAI